MVSRTLHYLDKEGLIYLWQKIKDKYADSFTGKELIDQIEKSECEESLNLKTKMVSEGKVGFKGETYAKAYDDSSYLNMPNPTGEVYNNLELDSNRLFMTSYRAVFQSAGPNISNTSTYSQGGCIYREYMFVPMTNAPCIDIISLSTLNKVGQISLPTVSGWNIHANTMQILTISGQLKAVISAEDPDKPGIILYNLTRNSSTDYTAAFDKAIPAPSDAELTYKNTLFVNANECWVTGYKQIGYKKETAVTDEIFYLDPPNTIHYIKYNFNYDSSDENKIFTRADGAGTEIVLPFADCTQGLFYDSTAKAIVQTYGYRGNKKWFAKVRIVPVENNTTNKFLQFRIDDRNTAGTFPQEKFEVQCMLKDANDWYAVRSLTNSNYYQVAKIAFERSYVDINGSDYFGIYYKGDEYRLNVAKAIELGVLTT